MMRVSISTVALCLLIVSVAGSDIGCRGQGDLLPIRVESDSLLFGTVMIGDHRDLPFSITNAGGGTLSGEVRLGPECLSYRLISGAGIYHLSAGQVHQGVLRYEPTDLMGPEFCTILTMTPP